jgi:hypothetical protein
VSEHLCPDHLAFTGHTNPTHVDLLLSENDSWRICVNNKPGHALMSRTRRIRDRQNKLDRKYLCLADSLESTHKPIGMPSIGAFMSRERAREVETHILFMSFELGIRSTHHILLPLSTHWSPLRSAFVLIPATSEPAPGSVCD